MLDDKATQYAQAFYGGDIPTTQAAVIKQSIMQLVMNFQSDIKAKFKDLDPSILEKATMSGLFNLHQLGAKHPNIHKSEGGMYIQAFQHAVSKVNELKTQKAQVVEKREAEAEVAEKISERDKYAGTIYDYFSRVKEWAFDQGYEHPALEAWKTLVNSNEFELAGYTFYIIAWRIPHENLIKEGRYPVTLYDHPEVIEIMNEHPKLPNRNGETRMEINYQKVDPMT